MFRPKLFGKKIEPNCIYCQHGKAAPGEQMILCIKKGVVSPYYSCKKFLYEMCIRDRIQELNAEYRGKDISTDVLSFPLGENGKFDKNRETGAYVLGDVVISAEKAVLQAEIYGHSLQREIAFLTVHSMLHILGYDHVAGGMEQVRMREKEEAIMLQLGLPRDASYVSEE